MQLERDILLQRNVIINLQISDVFCVSTPLDEELLINVKHTNIFGIV